MAKTRVGGKNGQFAPPTGINADWVSFDIESTQEVENDTAYADTQASKIGNGLPEHRISAGGFLFKGIASSAPGLAAGLTDVGGTFTATSDTGATHSGTLIVTSIRISNSRRVPASPITMSGEVDGAITETWPTT